MGNNESGDVTSVGGSSMLTVTQHQQQQQQQRQEQEEEEQWYNNSNKNNNYYHEEKNKKKKKKFKNKNKLKMKGDDNDNSSRTRILIPRQEVNIAPSASIMDHILFVLFWTIFIAYTLIILFDVWIMPRERWCPFYIDIDIDIDEDDEEQEEYDDDDVYEVGVLIGDDGYRTHYNTYYPNPDSLSYDPCYDYRTIYLLGMSLRDCDYGRRVLSSIVYGALIGSEQQRNDRPAGIRTMSLVCLGACIFTICGQSAFASSTQTWDAARVSAAVPSGVGFLGSALMWKETTTNTKTTITQHQVHGLTTACCIWLSASVGIGAGGALYLYSTWAVLLVMFVLRSGPKRITTTTAFLIPPIPTHSLDHDDEDDEHEHDNDNDDIVKNR